MNIFIRYIWYKTRILLKIYYHDYSDKNFYRYSWHASDQEYIFCFQANLVAMCSEVSVMESSTER